MEAPNPHCAAPGSKIKEGVQAPICWGNRKKTKKTAQVVPSGLLEL